MATSTKYRLTHILLQHIYCFFSIPCALLTTSYNKKLSEFSNLPLVDILGSIDNCIENNQLTCDKLEELARQKYLLRISTSTKKIALETIITIFDSQRIPLSSRERFDRKGNFPYYGATGILDYIDSYLFDGEYVLIAEDGTVIDNDGYPIVQIINDKFWVNNHAHILQGTNGQFAFTFFKERIGQHKFVLKMF